MLAHHHRIELMKFKLINESSEKTFALIFEKSDEVVSTFP